jgi:uncharacterized repeat protein (TIGR01451 family)
LLGIAAVVAAAGAMLLAQSTASADPVMGDSKNTMGLEGETAFIAQAAAGAGAQLCPGGITLASGMNIAATGNTNVPVGTNFQVLIDISDAELEHNGEQSKVEYDGGTVDWKCRKTLQAGAGYTTCSGPSNVDDGVGGSVDNVTMGCAGDNPGGGGTNTGFETGDFERLTFQCTAAGPAGLFLRDRDVDDDGVAEDPFGTSTLQPGGGIKNTIMHNHVSVTCIVPPTPVDISITKSAPATANIGGTGTYSLTINNPHSAAVNVDVSDAAPAGVTFTSITDGPACTFLAGSATCTSLVVPAMGNEVVDIGVQFDTCGTKNNAATVQFSAGQNFSDPNTANNTSNNAATNVDCPGLTVTKVADDNTATPGQVITYTITVTNDAGSAANGVTISDDIDDAPAATYSAANDAASSADCAGPPAGPVVCGPRNIAGGANTVFTIQTTMPAAGNHCNIVTTSATTPGTANDSDTACVLVEIPPPPFEGLVKDCDPDTNGTQTECNLFICLDQSSDGIDNDGDSVVDNEVNTCPAEFVIEELVSFGPDCDSPNDDDDGDGKPADECNATGANMESGPECANNLDDDGDGRVNDGCPQVGANPETGADCENATDDNDPAFDGAINDGCPAVGPECDAEAGGLCLPPSHPDIDKNGGELPEGLGAFEFQLKADHKIFDWPPTIEADVTIFGSDLDVDCSMTIVTENWILFGCVTTISPTAGESGAECADNADNDGDGIVNDGCPQGGAAAESGSQCGNNANDDPGDDGLVNDGCPAVADAPTSSGGSVIATITLSFEPDLVNRIRPTKDNGVIRVLLDENCELADRLGDPMEDFPGDLDGGLSPDCEDATITVRMLEGDLNLDCEVDIEDEQSIAFRYGAFFGSLFYDPFFDLEPKLAGDFDVDIKDLQFVFGRHGSTCDTPIPDQAPGSAPNGMP